MTHPTVWAPGAAELHTNLTSSWGLQGCSFYLVKNPPGWTISPECGNQDTELHLLLCYPWSTKGKLFRGQELREALLTLPMLSAGLASLREISPKTKPQKNRCDFPYPGESIMPSQHKPECCKSCLFSFFKKTQTWTADSSYAIKHKKNNQSDSLFQKLSSILKQFLEFYLQKRVPQS